MKRLPFLLFGLVVFALDVQAQNPGDKKPAASAEKKPAASAGVPKNVTADEAEKIIDTRKDVIVIDVRTPEEYEMGHIPGARNASFIDLEFEQLIKEFQGKPVLVHCASGARSTKALKKMVGKFPEIYHLDGGMKAWEAGKKEVVKSVPIPK